MLRRITIFAYGTVSYLIFFATFLYAVGFIGNIFVPKSMDSGPLRPFWEALILNSGLLTVFALQHSIMARQWFKKAWTRIVPEEAERSTYTLFSSLALILLFALWQPMGGVIWHLENQAARCLMYSLCTFGFLLVLVSTFLINHFDLFGLRQVWLCLLGKPYTKLPFTKPWIYKRLRHPLYLGWLFAFWATPTMTAAHLLFAVATTAYIFLAIQFEERDLVRAHGLAYVQYREEVPMIVPVKLGARREPATAGQTA